MVENGVRLDKAVSFFRLLLDTYDASVTRNPPRLSLFLSLCLSFVSQLVLVALWCKVSPTGRFPTR